MRNRWARLLVMIHIAGFSGAAVAQAPINHQDWLKCLTTSDPDIKISGCTAVISSGQETSESLAVALANRGLGYFDKGQLDHAMQDLTRAIQLDPSNIECCLELRGQIYDIKREYDKAIQDFTKAINLVGDDVELFIERGIAFSHQKSYARAIQDFDKAIRINPNIAKPFVNRGIAFRALGQKDRAAADFAMARERNLFGNAPEDPGLW